MAFPLCSPSPARREDFSASLRRDIRQAGEESRWLRRAARGGAGALILAYCLLHLAAVAVGLAAPDGRPREYGGPSWAVTLFGTLVVVLLFGGIGTWLVILQANVTQPRIQRWQLRTQLLELPWDQAEGIVAGLLHDDCPDTRRLAAGFLRDLRPPTDLIPSAPPPERSSELAADPLVRPS